MKQSPTKRGELLSLFIHANVCSLYKSTRTHTHTGFYSCVFKMAENDTVLQTLYNEGITPKSLSDYPQNKTSLTSCIWLIWLFLCRWRVSVNSESAVSLSCSIAGCYSVGATVICGGVCWFNSPCGDVYTVTWCGCVLPMGTESNINHWFFSGEILGLWLNTTPRLDNI